MHFVHTFDMELEFTSFYLSPDTFSYVVYTHFLHAIKEHSLNLQPLHKGGDSTFPKLMEMGQSEKFC